MNASRHVVAALLAAFLVAPALAQDPPRPAPAPAPAPQDVLAALHASMKTRYPLLEQMRDAGKVGETDAGEVKLVDAKYAGDKVVAADATKGTVGELVDAENKDRRALYPLLAKKIEQERKAKTSAADVAKENGKRNITNAKPEHWVEIKARWGQRKTLRIEDKKDEKKEPPKEGK